MSEQIPLSQSFLVPLSVVGIRDLSLVGAKAATLGELLAAGLPVPEGNCITTEAVSYWEQSGQWHREVEDFFEKLPSDVLFAVRSSSQAEDEGAFSGVFETVLGVRGAEALRRAASQVAQSAKSARAKEAYLAANKSLEMAPKIAILVQPLLPATVSGVLLSRDIERDGWMRVETIAGHAEALVNGKVTPSKMLLHRETFEANPKSDAPWMERLVRSALAIEALLGNAGVELEWLLSGDKLYIVQARRQKTDEERGLFVWDRAHNPMPLSEAQAYAARALDARERIPFRLRVIDGYLFVAPRKGAPVVSPRLTPDFAEFFEEEIAPKILGPILEEPKNLEDAMRRYVLFCEEYFCGILSGPRQVMEELRQFLAARGVLQGGERCPEGLPQDPTAALMAGTRTKNFRKDAELYAIAQIRQTNPPRAQELWEEFIALYGDEASGWDVCYKTLREDPTPAKEVLEAFSQKKGEPPEVRRRRAAKESANIARLLSEALPAEDRAIFHDKVTYARLLYPLLEEDDLLFSKAQAYLRKALLKAGAKAGLSEAEVFWVEPNEIGKAPLQELKEKAARNLAIAQSRAARAPLPPPMLNGETLQGQGASSGVATGKARILKDPSQAKLSPGEILVVPALVPTLSHLLFFAAGVIAEQGGTLSHAASMAREYNIPAVVGISGATQLFQDGETLLVDGKRGMIKRVIA